MLTLVLIFIGVILAGFITGVFFAKAVLNDAHDIAADLDHWKDMVSSDILDFEDRLHDLEQHTKGAAVSEVKAVEDRAKADVAKIESTAKNL